MEKYDYAIIGQGAAAFSAAIKANELGLKTAMIGKNETKGAVLGGTCINVGCVPSKRMITVADFTNELKQHRFSGVDYDIGKIEYASIVKEKKRLVSDLQKSKYEDVAGALENVTYINEFGAFENGESVSAGKESITAKKFLIATGARSFIPKLPGMEKIPYLDNESALAMEKLPESLIVVGGRALGLEFAQMFSRFGAKVTLLQRSERILPNWEPTISKHLEKYLRDEGISMMTNSEISSIRGREGSITASVKMGSGPEAKTAEIKSSAILFATGRIPNVEKLALANAEVKTDTSGFVKINPMMQTSNKNVYAAGDVTGNPMLETLAAKEGNLATVNAFTSGKRSISINEVPSAVFTEPEAAMVGSTEQQVIKDLGNCGCNALPMGMIAKASIISNTKGVIKIVINPKTHEILGVHMLAPHAADLIHEGVLAVKFHMKLEDIIDTIHVFPTLSEGFKLACMSFFADVSKMSCCTI